MQRIDIKEDEELIHAYQDGDREGINQLLKKYYSYMYKLLCYKGIPGDEAEDFTHDICVKLIRALHDFKFDSSFKTYLDRIINNKVIDHYRKKKRKKTESLFKVINYDDGDEIFLYQFIRDLNAGADQHIIYAELKQAMKLCLALIQNKTMQQLVNLWLNGMKRKQMALLLDVSLGYVNGTLERGKLIFRNCVRKRYGQI